MNGHLFSVKNGLTTAASAMPYGGGDIVLYQRETENSTSTINQLIKLLT